jgi:hypothetical protein
MKRIWEVTLMMETDINDFISIEEHVVNALKEHCDACCVTHAHPLPGLEPFSDSTLHLDMKYPLKRLNIDLLEDKDTHTLGKQVQYRSLTKILDTVKEAPLSSTVLHPRHRGKAEKLCRELGKMWLDEILYHFERQEKEGLMQKLKEVEDEGL